MAGVAEAIEAAATVELQRKLPSLKGELKGMEDAQIAKVFMALEKRSLTPEQAMYAWMELYNLRHLTKRLETRVAVGQVVVQSMVNPKDGGK